MSPSCSHVYASAPTPRRPNPHCPRPLPSLPPCRQGRDHELHSGSTSQAVAGVTPSQAVAGEAVAQGATSSPSTQVLELNALQNPQGIRMDPGPKMLAGNWIWIWIQRRKASHREVVSGKLHDSCGSAWPAPPHLGPPMLNQPQRTTPSRGKPQP